MTDPTAHPDDEDLIDHLAAGEPAGSGVGRHLATCHACAETAALLALVRDTVVDDARHPVPAAAVARAQALFRTMTAETGRGVAAPLAAMRRIAADLVFDSWGRLAPGFAGVRGNGESRHLVWQADEFDIDVQVQPADAGFGRLLGQVSAPEGGRALSCVLSDRSGEAVVSAGLDEFGAFALDAPAGAYDLLLETADAILVLPGIQVG